MSPDDHHDHGVLDEVGVNTTAIDLGATAQVSVVLPAGYRDEDRDDDVIADELSAEEIARQRAAELAAREADEADDLDDETDVDAADADDDVDADEGESFDAADADGVQDEDPRADDAPSDDDLDAALDADGEFADVESDDDPSQDGDADAEELLDVDGEFVDAEDDDDPSQGDGVVAEELVDADDEFSDADADDADAADVTVGAATDDAAEDLVDDLEDGADDEFDADASAPDLPDDVPDGQLDESAADEADDLAADGAADEAASDDADPDDATDDEAADRPAHDDAAADETPVDPPAARTHDDHSAAPVVAPIGGARSAREESAVTKRPEKTPEAPRARRESFIQPPARRAGEVSQDAARESSDVLTDDRLLDSGAIRKPEPEDPWRRIIYQATRGVINLGDSKKTRARKDLMAKIATPLPGRARFVPVMSRKGGVGKTTVTALLGMALADARDDRVVAVDANPDRGTLAERISKPSGKTVRDLVRSHDDVRGYSDISAHVTRDVTRLDVLASDADPHVADAFSDSDYRDVADIAQHFYSMVLTDTGTGVVHSVMDATLDLADQLVVVSGISVDEARLASETLTWLETNGYGEKAKNAIVVINQDTAGTPLVRLDELESHFRTRARDVVRIPYDARIATGSAIPFHELDRATRDAARRLAALVVEGVRAV